MPGSDQISAYLIQAGGKKLRSEIHKLINSIWNKEELPNQWKEFISEPFYEKGDKTDCSNYRGISLLSTSYKKCIQYSSLKVKSIYSEITGDRQCSFRRNRSTTAQTFVFIRHWRKKFEYNETVQQLFTDFKEAHDSVRRKVLDSILIEFVVDMEQVRPIKMCSNETYNKVRIAKYLYDNIRIQNDLK
jgi:hypothetical protein